MAIQILTMALPSSIQCPLPWSHPCPIVQQLFPFGTVARGQIPQFFTHPLICSSCFTSGPDFSTKAALQFFLLNFLRFHDDLRLVAHFSSLFEGIFHIFPHLQTFDVLFEVLHRCQNVRLLLSCGFLSNLYHVARFSLIMVPVSWRIFVVSRHFTSFLCGCWRLKAAGSPHFFRTLTVTIGTLIFSPPPFAIFSPTLRPSGRWLLRHPSLKVIRLLLRTTDRELEGDRTHIFFL